eukprot:Phypoly_transcript_02270.p1 GENE.Phypoly_transcript_02270~~Phypoly_transcript_02270.p1  ORF type:complete len:908 (+),score=182.89 Phypoly_transcript_02270:120-2726(+)
MADRRKDGTGTLHVLPDHIIAQILSLFSYSELINLSSVSAAFYVFCNDDGIWQDIFLEETNSTFTFDGSWKHATLQKFKKTDKELTLPKTLHFEGIYSMYLYTRWYRAHCDVSAFGIDNGDLERKKASELTVDDFINNYDALSRPVLLCGEIDQWKAHENWSRENLLKIYGQTEFKVSERGSRKFKMTMKDYLRYLDVQHDEEPLYIFDSGFGERAPGMLEDYGIPKYFPVDFFDVMGKYKPSFRWFVMGPQHSGAPWHTDPAGTSAWNALIHGKKRWLLYPPGDLPPGVIPSLAPTGEHVFISPPSLLWLLEVYPQLAEDEKPIECIQNPGEVIFVPAGWWHMVLNLEESIAVTQNYANDCNFNAVCEDFFSERREVYFYFKSKLLETKPDYKIRFRQFEEITDETTADFDDEEFWAPYVLQVLKEHNLPAPELSEVEVLSDGTNPVFLANGMVVKFYSKRYGGERNYKAETGMYKSAQASPIAAVCPKLLGHGKVEVTQIIHVKALDKHNNGAMSDGADSVPLLPASEIGKDLAENGKVRAENGKGHAEGSKDAENGKAHTENGKEHGENGKDATEAAHQNGKDHAENGKDQKEEKVDYPQASLKNKATEIPVSATWPYLIMEYISGTNLLTAREDNMQIDMEGVAKLLAQTTMVLHGLKVEEFINHEVGGVDDYTQFLKKRREKCVRAHWLWHTLPPALVSQIESYLPDVDNLQEIVCNEQVFTIHADLTDENMIGLEAEDTKKKKKSKAKKEGQEGQGGVWTPRYLLDFGDSRQGDIAYELVSLHISAFECKKETLKAFFETYKLPTGETLWAYYTKNKASMIKRLMACTLLHECNAFGTVFRHHPEAPKLASLDELATLLWDM